MNCKVYNSWLFIGFGLKKDLLILESDTKLAQKVKNKMREKLVLVSSDRPFDNFIKPKPPLCFSKENVLIVIGKLESIPGSPADSKFSW